MFTRLLIIFSIIGACQCAPVWENSASGELQWGDSLKLQSYELIVADFSSEESDVERVRLDVYDSGTLLASRALSRGESFSLNDSLRVVVDDIRMEEPEKEPLAMVRMQLAAAPEIEMILVSDHDFYEGGDDMKLELTVENTAAVEALSLKINMTSDPPILAKDYSISELKPGDIWDDDRRTAALEPILIKQKAPYLPCPTDVDVRVRANYLDSKKVAHQSVTGTTLRFAGPLQLHKNVKDIQEFGKRYFVINSLRNTGNRTLKIDFTDSTGQHFATDSPLKKELQMPPGSTEIISYEIEAKKPGKELIVPAAEASYLVDGRKYTVKTESPVVDVFGPYIEVQRAVQPSRVKDGEEIKVSTKVYNSGNKKSLVKVEQAIPAALEVIAGEQNGSFLLSPEESIALEMVLRCFGPDEINLPSASVEYRDVVGRNFWAKMPSVRIKIENESPAENLTATENATEGNETENEEIEGQLALEPDDGPGGFLALMVLFLLGTLFAIFSRYP